MHQTDGHNLHLFVKRDSSGYERNDCNNVEYYVINECFKCET